MARDRLDDDYEDDDRPARRDRADRDDDRDDDRPRRRPATTTATTVPGVLLILVGGLAVLLSLYTLAGAVIDPAGQVDGIRQARNQAEALPPGAQRDQQLKMYDSLEANIVTGELVMGGISLFTSALIALGGVALLRQRGYGLAMFGSILALLPCSNCAVCLAMPFGLWALITLMNADVKAAFRGRPSGPALES